MFIPYLLMFMHNMGNWDPADQVHDLANEYSNYYNGQFDLVEAAVYHYFVMEKGYSQDSKQQMKNFIALFLSDLLRAAEGVAVIIFTLNLQPLFIGDWYFNTFIDPDHTSRLYKMVLSTFAIKL